ncbi:MAG: hypothetical protein AAGG09_06585 [Pseudomonadota bacterium]
MAKKRSAAELKEEAAAVGAQLATARKKPVNFALLMAKEGIVLETDMKKSSDVLWRTAKKQKGGGSKGAQGTMKVNGKVIELTCPDDSAPTQLPKLAKKHLSELGHPYKVILITPSGQIGGEDEDEEGADATAAAEAGAEEAQGEAEGEAPEEAAAPAEGAPDEADGADTGDSERDLIMAEFEALADRLELAKTSVHAGAAKKSEKLSETFLAQVEQNPGKARGVLKMLTKAMDDAIAFGVAAPQAVETEAPAADSSGTESLFSLSAEDLAARGAEISKLRGRVDKLLAELA